MKSVVFVLSLLFFGVGLVSAADCTIEIGPGCSVGEAVPGIWFSNDVNSHVTTVSNPGHFDYVLCCDPLNISLGSGTNNVVRLFSFENTHVGTILGSSYPNILTMQNATCRDTGAACFGDEFCLFSLALQTNSHVSECGTPGYGINICCNSTLGGGPGLGICGDSIIDDPNINGLSEECDGTNLDGENCTSLGYDGGTLVCNTVGSIDQCLFNESGCFNVNTQPPVVGPDEYYVYSNCEDDGDGDEYGEANWTIYAGDGSVDSTGVIVCQLSSEEIPLFGNLSILMFLVIISIFYVYNYLRRCNNANCYQH